MGILVLIILFERKFQRGDSSGLLPSSPSVANSWSLLSFPFHTRASILVEAFASALAEAPALAPELQPCLLASPKPRLSSFTLQVLLLSLLTQIIIIIFFFFIIIIVVIVVIIFFFFASFLFQSLDPWMLSVTILMHGPNS